MKALTINETFKEEALQQFLNMLNNYKPTDGALSFKIDPSAAAENQKVEVRMTGNAYLKMIALIQECSIEIAWHGLVERNDDYTFTITDILCYPQEAAAATVDAKEKEYMEWLMSLDDDVVNKMSFQGHSHVNMAVSPSGRDTDNWNKLFNMCQTADAFYIVCIANKSGSTTWRVHDNKTGFLYEDKDIVFKVITDDGLSIKDWGKETVKENVTEIKYTCKNNTTYISNEPSYKSHRTYADVCVTNSMLSEKELIEAQEKAMEDYDLFMTWVTGARWDNNLQCYIRPKKNKKGGKKK